MKKNEELNKEFNEKKPKKKALVFGIILLILIIVALGVMYFIEKSKPENIYYSAIEKALKTEKTEYKSIKINTKTKITAEADNNENEEVLKKLGKCIFNFGVQLDSENKREIVKLGLDYEEKPEISAQLYCNGNGEIYAYLNDLFDKYIKIDLEDEQKENLKNIFESTAEQEKTNKAIKEIKEELKKQLKEIDSFEQEEATIKINDEEQKVKKTSIKFTDEQVCNMLSDIYTNLSENKEYLECLDDSQKDNLKEVATMIEKIETNGKNTIKVSLYTKGLLNELIGTNIELYSAKEEQTITIAIVKESKNSYKYDVSMKMIGMKANIVKGEVIIDKEKIDNGEKGKVTLTAETSEIMELGKAKIEIEYDLTYNEKVDEVNVENSINVNELTQENILEITTKLIQKPLLGEIFSTGLFDNLDSEENGDIQNDDIVSDDFWDLEI
ncbi:MAG: hypothetical protein ACI4UX_03985 [Clostridia bacterium]